MTTTTKGTRAPYAARGVAPDKEQLQKYLDRGLTQQQIVEAWREDSGEKVSRAAIAMAMKRYELAAQKPRPRYEDMLPWTVKPEHASLLDAKMLRAEARRRRGQELSDLDKKRLTSWRRRLQEADAVIAYAPDTKEGFFWVVRLSTDDDIIRRDAI